MLFVSVVCVQQANDIDTKNGGAQSAPIPVAPRTKSSRSAWSAVARRIRFSQLFKFAQPHLHCMR